MLMAPSQEAPTRRVHVFNLSPTAPFPGRHCSSPAHPRVTRIFRSDRSTQALINSEITTKSIILSVFGKPDPAERPNEPTDTTIASLFDTMYAPPSIHRGRFLWLCYGGCTPCFSLLGRARDRPCGWWQTHVSQPLPTQSMCVANRHGSMQSLRRL